MKHLQFKPWLLAACLLLAVTLACATNTPVAQVATPPPTRTPLPTFTVTPIPPSATPVPTPTPTPIFTDTPIPTDTLSPTATSLPATDTPVPTNTPLPPPTNPPPPPVPPTNTPAPPPPVVQENSPVSTPTNTPEPGTPPGRYEIRSMGGDNNCADIGVTGRVREKGSDRPVPFVTIEVKGEDDYKGPYIGKTDQDGRYNIYIGPLEDEVNGVEFSAKVVGGPGVESEDEAEWETSDDCDGDDNIQIMKIDWDKKGG